MSGYDVAAQACIKRWDRAGSITMVAIGAAESGEFSNFRGDPLTAFPGHPEYAPYAVGGYLSFGPWQVFLPSWNGALRKITDTDAPSDWASWLMDVDRSCAFAWHVWLNQGVSAWSTFNNGAYKRFMDAAAIAVAAALDQPAPAPDKRDVQISIDAAVRDAISSLAGGRWLARHSDDKRYVIIQSPPGRDATTWLPVKPIG